MGWGREFQGGWTALGGSARRLILCVPPIRRGSARRRGCLLGAATGGWGQEGLRLGTWPITYFLASVNMRRLRGPETEAHVSAAPAAVTRKRCSERGRCAVVFWAAAYAQGAYSARAWRVSLKHAQRSAAQDVTTFTEADVE